jgi:hypothetical protein
VSVEIHDSLIALLAEVAALKERETATKGEKQRQQEAIPLAESEVSRCNGELDEIREAQLKAKRTMDGLRDALFAREDEETIVADDAHVVTDGESSQTGSEAKRAWDARAKHLKQVR